MCVWGGYKWSQTVTDIDVRVPVPEGTTSKHVKVDIKSDHLKVELLLPEASGWYVSPVGGQLDSSQKWSPYKVKGPFSTLICTRKGKNGR